MSLDEMMRLQGMDPEKLVKAVPPTELGKLLGNAMSVNVVERVLCQALKHANLLSQTARDSWESHDVANQGALDAASDRDAVNGDTCSRKCFRGVCYSRAREGRVRRFIVD